MAGFFRTVPDPAFRTGIQRPLMCFGSTGPDCAA